MSDLDDAASSGGAPKAMSNNEVYSLKGRETDRFQQESVVQIGAFFKVKHPFTRRSLGARKDGM